MPTYHLTKDLHREIARQLYEAEQSVTPVELITKEHPGLTEDDAYAIQTEGLSMRLNDGVRIIGRKIGITSKGVMEALGCDSPDYGYLLSYMQIPAGGSCPRSEMHAPVVEGELAFVMKRDLRSAPVTPEDVIAATDYITPCFEICDSRYATWNFTVPDVIADGAAAARFVLGVSTRTLSDIDPASVGMTMKKNGEVISKVAGSEVMGSPVNSVTWLANKLLEYGDFLRAGDIVLSGSFTKADAAESGDTYTMILQGFYPLTITFV